MIHIWIVNIKSYALNDSASCLEKKPKPYPTTKKTKKQTTPQTKQASKQPANHNSPFDSLIHLNFLVW